MLLSIVLILADNLEDAGVHASMLKHRGLESRVIRYGPHGGAIRLPRRYDLVLIDSYYASAGALAIVRQLRDECTKPIVLLTHETDDRYQIDAYAAGVNECVVRPIDPLLLLAKLAVWLKKCTILPSREELVRSSYNQTPRYDDLKVDNPTLDPKSRQVTTRDGRNVKLSVQEARLFQIFLANPGRVLETNYLLSRIWHSDKDVDARLLTNLIYRLRQKLYTGSKKINQIRSIDRIGYIFE